jgi:hypothetical protein
MTPSGKLLEAIVVLVSRGLLVPSSGIVAAGFTEEMRCRDVICPHCGKKIAGSEQEHRSG